MPFPIRAYVLLYLIYGYKPPGNLKPGISAAASRAITPANGTGGADAACTRGQIVAVLRRAMNGQIRAVYAGPSIGHL